jgi:nucleoside-diphosphate-sugar epimerase
LRAGTSRLPKEDHFTNRIHRDDLAGVLEWLMDHAVEVDRLLVSDDDPAPYSEVVRYLAQELGVSAPKVDETAPPRQRGGNKRCSNRRLRELGIPLVYPSFREGYAPTLRTS